MPYEMLERKFHSLPESSFAEVSSFFDYILYKFGEKHNVEDAADSDVEKINALCEGLNAERRNDTSLMSMREALKDDTW